MDQPTLSINGFHIENRSPAVLLETLFLCVDFVYSPLETIRENIKELFSIAEEYFFEKKKFLKGKEKMECTKVLKLMNVWKTALPFMGREQMLRAYWDYKMRNEKLSLLSGFGDAQKGERLIHLNINPEKTSLRSIPDNK